jgi:2,3-dihydroxy-p-cumate/2,3-dihydroxybenzoate 3,4-dioxygenase
MRYARLGYVALNVSDLGRSARFYSELVGLSLSDRDSDCVAFRCSPRHHDILLYRSDSPGLKRIGWQMESDQELEIARARCEQLGLNPLPVDKAELDRLHQRSSFRVVEPNTGVTFEYFSSQDECAPFAPTVTKIQRLGHVVLTAARWQQAVDFLVGKLEFRVSDAIQDTIVFLRCFPNPFHHSIGLAQAPETRLNHVNFMVTDVDDVGRALNRLRDAGVPIVFGPGRHVPSESIFLYFLDPDGITLEFSFGMEEFPEKQPRAPRMLERRLDVLDSWGGKPKPELGAVGAIERGGARR